MKATLSKDCTRQVSHPSKPGLLEPGESCECDELWARQHLALQRTGELDVSGSEKKAARCQATTNSGSQCKRTALDGEKFCATHSEAG